MYVCEKPIHLCVCVFMRVYIGIFTFMCVCMCVCIYILYIYIYIYIYMYIYSEVGEYAITYMRHLCGIRKRVPLLDGIDQNLSA